MRAVQVELKITRVGDAATNGKYEKIEIYTDANNTYEALCGALNEAFLIAEPPVVTRSTNVTEGDVAPGPFPRHSKKEQIYDETKNDLVCECGHIYFVHFLSSPSTTEKPFIGCRYCACQEFKEKE